MSGIGITVGAPATSPTISSLTTPTTILTCSSRPTTTYLSHLFPRFTTSVNLGPLTGSTSFPQNCYRELYDMRRDGLGPSGAWKTQGCNLSSCCPYGRIYSEEWAWMTSYYSPGICPQDYRTCSPPTLPALALTTNPRERIAFCCPNNYICPNDEDMLKEAPGACGSRLTSSPIFTSFTVMDNLFNQTAIRVELYEFEPCFTQEIQIAYPIQVRMSAPFTTTVTAISGSGRGQLVDSVGAGGIASIAVGAFLALCVVVGFVCFCLWMRQKKLPQYDGPGADKRILSSRSSTVRMIQHELCSGQIEVELDSVEVPPGELDASVSPWHMQDSPKPSQLTSE